MHFTCYVYMEGFLKSGHIRMWPDLRKPNMYHSVIHRTKNTVQFKIHNLYTHLFYHTKPIDTARLLKSPYKFTGHYLPQLDYLRRTAISSSQSLTQNFD